MTANSLDAVGDRDFVVEALAAIALGMVHLSRLAEEITWWSNPRFGFVRASDAFSTGSSIMPNKKNPDPAELVRGRAARVIGALTGVLTLLKGLPLGYQRDLQEDKAPLFDAVAVFEASLGVLAGMLDTLTVDRERMRAAADEGYTTATAVADALVRRGIPFRVAHHVVGSLVAQAEEAGVRLDEVPDSMIGLALGASGDERRQGARRGRGDRRHPARGRVGGRRPRDLRRHRRHGPGAGRGRACVPPGSAWTRSLPPAASARPTSDLGRRADRDVADEVRIARPGDRDHDVELSRRTGRAACGPWAGGARRGRPRTRRSRASPPNSPVSGEPPAHSVIVSSRPPLTVALAVTRSSSRTSWTSRDSTHASSSARPRNGAPMHSGAARARSSRAGRRPATSARRTERELGDVDDTGAQQRGRLEDRAPAVPRRDRIHRHPGSRASTQSTRSSVPSNVAGPSRGHGHLERGSRASHPAPSAQSAQHGDRDPGQVLAARCASRCGCGPCESVVVWS